MAFDFENNIEQNSLTPDNLMHDALMYALSKCCHLSDMTSDTIPTIIQDKSYNDRACCSLNHTQMYDLLLKDYPIKFKSFLQYASIMSWLYEIYPKDLINVINIAEERESLDRQCGYTDESFYKYGQKRNKPITIDVFFIGHSTLEDDNIEWTDICKINPGVYRNIKCDTPYHNWHEYTYESRPKIGRFYIDPTVLLHYIGLSAVFNDTLSLFEVPNYNIDIDCATDSIVNHVFTSCHCPVSLIKKAVTMWMCNTGYRNIGERLFLGQISEIFIKCILYHLTCMGKEGRNIFAKHIDFLNDWQDRWSSDEDKVANRFFEHLMPVINDILNSKSYKES